MIVDRYQSNSKCQEKLLIINKVQYYPHLLETNSKMIEKSGQAVFIKFTEKNIS